MNRNYLNILANNGLLSQVIGNLMQNYNTLKKAMEDGAFLKDNNIDALSDYLSDCCISFVSLQTELCTFTKDLRDMLTSLINAPIAIEDLERVQYLAGCQMDRMDKFRNKITTTSSKIQPALDSLNSQYSKYDLELTEVNLKLADAEKQSKKYNDQKYYFLALGILGLPGLATAIALLVTWQKKADGYKTEQNKLHRIVKQIEFCKTTVSSLQEECSDTVNQLIHVCNTIDMIKSNIQAVKENMEHKEFVELFLNSSIDIINRLSDMVD